VTEDDEILAAEFALGVLDEGDAVRVQDRARTDAALSLRIAWWRDQLAPLAGEGATQPPAGVWRRIEAQLPGNDNRSTQVQRWRAAALAAMTMAAALLLFIGLRPSPIATPEAPAMLMAALSGDRGSVVAIGYDVASGRLTVAPTKLDPGKGDAELWIIPDGGAPVSLGVVSAARTAPHIVRGDVQRLLRAGATFAISQEAAGGSPTGKPQGAIVASGKIFRT
jgi:anti-sigma-K factor RskA